VVGDNPPRRRDLRAIDGGRDALTHARGHSYKPAIFPVFRPVFKPQRTSRVQHRHLPPAPVDRALRLRAGPGLRSALAMLVAIAAAWFEAGAVAADTMMTPEASAGALASLPAKGLAAAIAEAGRI